MNPRAHPIAARVSRLSVFTLSFYFAAGVPARLGADDEPVVELPPVTVISMPVVERPAVITPVEFTDEPLVFHTPSGLSDRAANFHVGASDARSFNDTFALRGLTNTPIFGPPAVTVYLDDLPLGSSFIVPTELAGFTRGELHRGPGQNTLFGRAGPAGVMSFITPEPSSHASGEIRGSIGEYDARAISVRQQSAAGGHVDAYVSAAYSTRDGYVDNTRLGRDVDFKESISGLARIRFRPTQPLELTLLVTAQQAEDGAQPFVPLGGPFFTVTRESEGETNLEAVNIALTAAMATSIGRVSTVNSYSDWDLSPYSSVLAFGPQELTNVVEQSQRTWNEEVKLTSDEEAAIRWRVGAFFSAGRTEGAFTRRFGPLTFEQSSFEIDSRDVAGFGEMTLPLSEGLSLTAGLRVETARREMERRETVPAAQAFSLQTRSSALLPKLGLNYSLARQTTAFATIGTGYKPGGFSAFTGDPDLAEFGPERTRAAEAGVSYANATKTTSATARVFYYEITGYQIERSFATGALADDYLVVNAERARSFGGEVEISRTFFESLTASVDLGITSVKLRRFRDPFTGDDYGGNRAPYVPIYDASMRLAYRHRRGWLGDIELTANGKTFYTEDEDSAFAQKAYALLRARLGYDTGRYRIIVFGENLTDEEYYRSISPGTFHGTPGAPRTVGVEVGCTW